MLSVVEAMVVSGSVRFYARKYMHDLQMGNIGMQSGALQTNLSKGAESGSKPESP